MNPHFLFNSLSAIQNVVLRESKMVAAEQVAKFAKFIRFVLDSSRCNLISLEGEMEAIELFLDLQEVRFPNLFSYSINLEIHDDASEILVPPLIIQPFVENSVIHGFQKDRSDGFIQIDIKQNSKYLLCNITDNGIGYSNAPKRKEGTHKSVATQITRDRLELLNKRYKCTASMDIKEVDGGAGSGTVVHLKLPLLFTESGN